MAWEIKGRAEAVRAASGAGQQDALCENGGERAQTFENGGGGIALAARGMQDFFLRAEVHDELDEA